VKKSTLESLERIWARSTGHVMGKTDQDIPVTPILTQIEARISLVLRSFWVFMHVFTCLLIAINIIHHW